MQIKIKRLFAAAFAVSLFANGLFSLLFILAARSPVKMLSFPQLGKNHMAAAAVVTFPAGRSATFDLVEISLAPGEKASLQFSVIAGKSQANLLVNALYDPNVIAVAAAGYGVEITALSAGSTLMQSITNDGIKNIALITVAQ